MTEPVQNTARMKKADEKTGGLYRCAVCHAPLFSPEAKVDAGTGYPSYYAPVREENVATEERRSHGVPRTEALCAACDAHLGHVFDDDAQPTGRRYCIIAAALVFEGAPPA